MICLNQWLWLRCHPVNMKHQVPVPVHAMSWHPSSRGKPQRRQNFFFSGSLQGLRQMVGICPSLQVCAGCAVHALTQPGNMPVLVTTRVDTAIGPLVFFWSCYLLLFTSYRNTVSSLPFNHSPFPLVLISIFSPPLRLLSRILRGLLVVVFHFIPANIETGPSGHARGIVSRRVAPITSKTALP